jgi:fumarate reductase flavoprotein subunit
MRFDVIAIGGGFAGLVAANRCAQLGLRAAVLEKQQGERYACNSRYTTGVSHILFQDMRQPGEALERVINEATLGRADPALVRAFAHTSRRAVDWLREEGARFMEVNTPTGRSLMLAPPRRFKEGLDWEGRGADVLLRRLEENLSRRGGQVLRGVRAESLAMKDCACMGVEAQRAGEPARFEAGAVIVADGGFTSNLDMLRLYITPRAHRLLLRAHASASGDGLRMAQAAGAHLTGFGEFYGHPVHRDAVTEQNAQLWPFPMIDALTQTGVVVGDDGQRFADEGRGGIVLANTMAHLPDPLSTTLVFDERLWTTVGREGPTGNPMITTLGATLHRANDLGALAERAHLPPAPLADTVARYNDALARGEAARLDPPRSMQPVAAQPIKEPPFYAMPLCCGITATMGGIAIDTECRALKGDGSAIPGLYAAGSTVAGLEGGPGYAYLGGLSKAFILGLLAAEAIAKRAGKAG